MNQNQPVLSQAPPAIPYQNGRPGQGHPYPPPSPYPAYYYPPQYAYHYHQMQRPPPPQWHPYQMQMQMGRGHPGYPHMNAYPPQPQYHPMRPPPQHHPSSASVHSPQPMLSPSPPVHAPFPPPSMPMPTQSPQPPAAAPVPPPRSPSPAETVPPFYPPLPWQNFEGDLPGRSSRRKRTPQPQNTTLELPNGLTSVMEPVEVTGSKTSVEEQKRDVSVGPASNETPPNSNAPSEILSTQPTTPTSSVPPQQITPKASKASHTPVPSLSIRPAIPNISLPSRATKKTATESIKSESRRPTTSDDSQALANAENAEHNKQPEIDSAAESKAPVKAPPKSWADLVRSKANPQAATPSARDATATSTSQPNGATIAHSTSLADVLNSFNVQSDEKDKLAFLEPRGLVNTGNMCYMNSVLQVLLFCTPFYAFLERVGKQAVYSFKNGTPMLDAMIMFMHEFKVIDAAVSIDQLRLRLKDNELEQYGEAFIPEFVYDVIKRLPRFSSMRRGHQQDAEEFLGFLLEELHDECIRSMKDGERDISGASSPNSILKSPSSELSSTQATDESGWLEVGPKQRPAITRSSGNIAAESPINKIFGGKLRSELRVPGMKNSVTLEPYQPLQLDIGAANINTIVDALKGLTKPETLHGQFNSPRGPGSTATKQVSIETLPQVLILHLKRFQYDNAGGTQKIWKKIGYPLDLEIPKEVFPQHKRGGLTAHRSLPKYRLIGVVYHHGKNASTGHYTVDVRRQEGREWIRLDDTVIRRIRSEDVAAGGNEEDPKALAAALEQHKKDTASDSQSTNVYEQIMQDEMDEQPKVEKVWSQVAEASNGVGASKSQRKKSAATTPKPTESGKMTPVGRPTSIKDNKVAYILIYQKVGP